MQKLRDYEVPDPGFDPTDPASVAARRSEILALEEAAAAMLAAGTALQLRAHAAAYEFGHALDVAEGCASSAMHVRSIADEIGLLVRLAPGTAQGQLALASLTLQEFPTLAVALEANAVTPAQVHRLVEVGLKINHADPAEQSARRDLFVNVMLERVRREPLPPKALQNAAERVAEELTEESITQRHARAKRQRRVTIEDVGDGMSVLRILTDTFVAHAIQDRARKQARAIIRDRPKPDANTTSPDVPTVAPASDEARASIESPTTSDERTLNEVMSDVVVDMLLTSDPRGNSAAAGIQATVHLSIPITTALAQIDQPGQAPALLDGMSPMPIDEAKRLAATAPAFIRVLTHPITGAVQAVDSYKPTQAMRTFLHARDIHCRFIGCRQPAARCELDHTIDHQYGGKTAVWNLSDFCKNHHIVKHHTAWDVTQYDNGILEWTTPSGKPYIGRPEPHGVTFRPTDELMRLRPDATITQDNTDDRRRAEHAPAPAPDPVPEHGPAQEHAPTPAPTQGTRLPIAASSAGDSREPTGDDDWGSPPPVAPPAAPSDDPPF